MTMERPRFSTRMILGVGIVLLGVALLLERLELFDAERLTRFWPVILIAVGLKVLMEAARTGRWVGGAVITLLGLIFLGRELDLIGFGVGELWPLFIILAGLGILARGFRRGGDDRASRDERISQFGILCGLSPKISSPEFKGGEINAFMGGVEVDLREAGVGEEGAVIVVFAMMGGIEIVVPRDWTVNTNVTPFMGAVEDKTDRSESDPAKRLTIKGFVMMGGIEVRN